METRSFRELLLSGVCASSPSGIMTPEELELSCSRAPTTAQIVAWCEGTLERIRKSCARKRALIALLEEMDQTIQDLTVDRLLSVSYLADPFDPGWREREQLALLRTALYSWTIDFILELLKSHPRMEDLVFVGMFFGRVRRCLMVSRSFSLVIISVYHYHMELCEIGQLLSRSLLWRKPSLILDLAMECNIPLLLYWRSQDVEAMFPSKRARCKRLMRSAAEGTLLES